MNVRYIRISTGGQKIDRQLREQFKDEKLFIDVCSGSIPFNDREQGKQLIKNIEAISYLSIDAVDRLGRNLLDILTTLQYFEDNLVCVKVDNLGIESLIDGKPNAAFKMIISVLSNIAEMERNTMLERQRQGIAIAKAKGAYKGRIKGSTESQKDFMARYPNVIKQLSNGHSLRNTAKLCDVSLGTVQKVKGFLSS